MSKDIVFEKTRSVFVECAKFEQYMHTEEHDENMLNFAQQRQVL